MLRQYPGDRTKRKGYFVVVPSLKALKLNDLKRNNSQVMSKHLNQYSFIVRRSVTQNSHRFNTLQQISDMPNLVVLESW